MFSFNFSPYVVPDHKEALLKYKYVGEDRSLIYKYFWRPLCTKSVSYLPMWLAPNTITVTGLAGVSLMHVILLWYMPSLTIETPDATVPPAIVFLLSGVFLFLYQFLDNLDGHQARRTGSSSPLGLLMDHGCDAFNCIVGSLSVASAVCTGPSWKTWAAMVSAVVVFFCNTWEEYYRGALILPFINGPNEGILVAISIYFITAVLGPAFWLQSFVLPVAVLPSALQEWMAALHQAPAGSDALGGFVARSIQDHMSPTNWWLNYGLPATPFGFDLSWLSQVYDPSDAIGDMLLTLKTNLVASDAGAVTGITFQYNTVAVLSMCAMGFVTICGNFFQVWLAVSRDPSGHGKYGHGWLIRRFPFVHALTRLLPLFFVTVLANIWFMHSPKQIFAAHPRMFCWTVGLLYTKLAIHLMISHLCSTEFHPFRRTMIPFLYFGVHISVSRFLQLSKHSNRSVETSHWIENETLVLYEFFGLSAVTFLHLAINAASEMARVLDIDVFSNARQRARAAAIAAGKKN